MRQSEQRGQKEQNVEREMWGYVPWSYAVREWQSLAPNDKYSEEPPVSQNHEPHQCPTCGWPSTGRGFVSLHFPLGHRLFGKAICCPTCWPAPFGQAKHGYLSDKMLEIAAKWDKILREGR